MSSTRLSRRELALVAAALLLPVPVIAESGLSLPFPDAVQQGFGSLITLDAKDDGSGTTATGGTPENGAGPPRSADASRSAARANDSSTSSRTESHHDGVRASGGSADSWGGRDSRTAATPKGGGDTDDSGSSVDTGGTDRPRSPGGTDTPRGDAGRAPQSEPDRMPSVGLRVAGQGTASGVSVSADGVDADSGADSRGARDHGTAGVGLDVTDTTGSRTGTGMTVSDTGVSLH